MAVRMKHMTYGSKMARDKARVGLLFSLPTIIGLLLLFLLPLLQSVRMAFSNVTVTHGAGLQYQFAGLANFIYALRVNPDFSRQLADSVVQMAETVPVIVMFSFFASILINQKFPGRSAVRVIFFLPIIYASSALQKVDSNDVFQTTLRDASFKSMGLGQSFLQSFRLSDFMLQFGLPTWFIQTLSSAVDMVYQIISLSGVQILVMLAALQSISPSMYEAAHVEGARGWEKFWLVTFPLATPALLLCVIYSIIDSFVAYNNPIVLLTQQMMSQMKYAYSSAMSWIYFVIIALILSLVGFFGSRHVFSYDRDH